jgi:serine/threonine protein kinase
VMFELLTGHVPFNGPGPAQVCAAVLTERIPPFSDYRDDVPPALQAIVLRCLERDRERRFGDVGELAAALGVLAPAAAVPAMRASSTVLALAPPKRGARRWLGAFCTVIVLGACGTVLGLAVRDGRIRLPTGEDVRRLPATISTWRIPLLSPTPEQRETTPVGQVVPTAAPSVALEGPVAPVSAPHPPTNVQVRASVPNVATSRPRPVARPQSVAPPRSPAQLPEVNAEPGAPAATDSADTSNDSVDSRAP